jgi:hypothetical protein
MQHQLLSVIATLTLQQYRCPLTALFLMDSMTNGFSAEDIFHQILVKLATFHHRRQPSDIQGAHLARSGHPPGRCGTTSVAVNEVDTLICFYAAVFSPVSGLSGFSITTANSCHLRHDNGRRSLFRCDTTDGAIPMLFVIPLAEAPASMPASSRSMKPDDGHVGTCFNVLNSDST